MFPNLLIQNFIFIRFCQISGQEVPQLIQMIGPSPANFKGQSERVDELILQISKKLR